MALDLDKINSKAVGVGVLASMSGLTSSGLQVAAFAALTFPALASMSCYAGTMGIAATATGLGDGVLHFSRKQVQDLLEAKNEKHIFQLVAQENALHRKVWRAVQSYAVTVKARNEVEALLTKAREEVAKPRDLKQYGAQNQEKFVDKLKEVFPASVDLDLLMGEEGTVKHVSEVREFVSMAQELRESMSSTATIAAEHSPVGAVTSVINMPMQVSAIHEAASHLMSGKPSAAGERLREMGKHAGFGGKTLEQAVDAVMSAPLTYVSPAPPGVVMFDASNTTRSVRMVVQHLGDPTSAVYVAECTPYTLESGVLYEVFFQVSGGVWVDVKQWNAETKQWVVPTQTHKFSLNGASAYRWFHLTGPLPLFIENVENEDGPMW